jgi:hypothetical protein
LLETTVTKDCQQIIAGRYPLSARADIPLNDFARLFAPNGVLDNFFKSYLAAHGHLRPHWTWRQGSANLLSAARRHSRCGLDQAGIFQDGSGPAMTLTIAANPARNDGQFREWGNNHPARRSGGSHAMAGNAHDMISAEVANRPPTTVGAMVHGRCPGRNGSCERTDRLRSRST